jgi:hypothetical protein
MGTQGKSFLIYRAIPLLLVGLLSLIFAGVAEAILINHKLSGSLVTGGDVKLFEISPDGGYAVFLGDARTNSVDELFSVPTGGGERIRLSQELASGLLVQGFVITPDSQTVVYWIGDVDGLCTGMYAVPIGGGTPVNISGVMPEYKKIIQIEISADSQYAVYTLYHWEEWIDAYEVLWAAALDGSGSIAYTSESCDTCSIEFEVTPSGAQVVYRLRQWGPTKLYRGNMLGESILLLESHEGIGDFAITADGDWIVYTIAFDYPKYELFSIAMGGGTPIQLSGTMEDGRAVQDFKVAANSQTVVYRADELVDEKMELFSVPVDGSATRVRLLDVMIAEGDVTEYQIAPNSQGVVFMADYLADERIDLWAVGMNGGAVYTLTHGIGEEGDVTTFSITPNSLGVAFVADMDSNEKYELYIVSVVGTLLHRLNADLPTEGDVLDFKIAPNSQGVVYRADQVFNDVINLYAVPSVGEAIPVRLNMPLVLGGDVHEGYAITPDSKGVLYLADQEEDGVDELFATFDRLPVYLPLAMK